MKVLHTTLLIFVIYCSAFSQKANQPIDLNAFDKQLFTSLIHEGINSVRDSLGADALAIDPILVKAAGLQAIYCQKQGRLTHYQKKNKLYAPADRVRYFEGIHGGVGENLIRSGISPSTTYQQLADQFVDSWVKSAGHFRNLKNPEFGLTGVAVQIDLKRKRVYVAQVFGTPIPFFDGYPTPFGAYGIIPNRSDKCEECLEGLDTLHRVPAGINPYLYDQTLYLSYSNLSHFTKLFKSNRYHFAVDILLRRQFACGKPNMLHGSPVHDGYLSKPVGREILLETNTDSAANRLMAPMGVIPFKLNEQYELNLMVLKKKWLSKKYFLCKKYMFSPVYGTNLDVMVADMKLDTTLLPNKELTTRKTIKLLIPFEKNKYEYKQADIQPLYDSLHLNKFNIKRIAITAYASAEGSTALNQKLQRKRAESIVKVLQSYQLDTVPTRIRTFENWQELQRDIKGTPYERLAKLDKQGVKDALDSLWTEMEPILSKHRKAIVWLGVEEKIDLEERIAELPSIYQKVLNSSTMALKDRISVQTKVFNAIEQNQLPISILTDHPVPPSEYNLDLLNNELVFKYENYEDKPTLEQLEALEKLAAKRPDILFNCYGLMIEWWYHHNYYELDYRSLVRKINTLGKLKAIDQGELYKLLVNYHITLASHLLGKEKYRERMKSVDFVIRYHTRAKLTDKDALVLANYLTYHWQIRKAVDLLRPFTLKEDVDEEVLFYYLNISIFNYSHSQEFVTNMEKARGINKPRYCQLFGYPKLTFQLLRNPALKKMYCDYCE